MPRLVTKTAQAPIQVGDKTICMCGLSKNQPFCDKSHLKTLDEDKTKLYVYTEDGRDEVVTGDDCEGGCCGGGCCQNDSEEKSKPKK